MNTNDMKTSLKNSNEYRQPLKFSNMKPLEVIEPYNPQIVEFETIDDFNIYYNKHPDEFADKTTQKLNTKYKIPGYRLTKANKELKIIKDYRNANNDSKLNNSNTDSKLFNSLLTRISIIEKQIKEITDYLQNMNS